MFALLPVDMAVARLFGPDADAVRDALQKVYIGHVASMANQSGIAPSLGCEIAEGMLKDRFDRYVAALKSVQSDSGRAMAIGWTASAMVTGKTNRDPLIAVPIGMFFFSLLASAAKEAEQLKGSDQTQ